jgi:O-antigen biosynthesis protein
MRGRVLVVDHQTPTPDQDSGSVSTFAYLRILAASGFSVTFASPNLADDGPYTRALNELGIDTPMAGEWASLNAVIEILGPQTDVLLLFRAGVAMNIIDLARRSAPAAKILFHPVDLHFLRMQREAAITGDRKLADSSHEMRAIELDLIRKADATIVVSSHESSLLENLVPGAVVHQIPILRDTPLPLGILGCPNFDARRHFLFIGGYAHPPNVDAVLWFVREVWPRIQEKGYQDRFIIAGSNLPSEIAVLASDRIEVRGHVIDLGSLFNTCRLSIAPLRYGAGIKGKIVSSLSYGVPVVASSVAAEGMSLRHEEDVLVADDPDLMADQIVRLYNDANLWLRLSSNGYDAFRNTFSEATGKTKVIAVFDSLARRSLPSKLRHALQRAAKLALRWSTLRRLREGIALRKIFDGDWYLATYPDVARAGLDPLSHYLEHGAAEGRDPGPSFSTRGYLRSYPDVAALGVNPLLHYVRNAPIPLAKFWTIGR